MLTIIDAIHDTSQDDFTFIRRTDDNRTQSLAGLAANMVGEPAYSKDLFAME
jgi:hypothetical protein